MIWAYKLSFNFVECHRTMITSGLSTLSGTLRASTRQPIRRRSTAGRRRRSSGTVLDISLVLNSQVLLAFPWVLFLYRSLLRSSLSQLSVLRFYSTGTYFTSSDRQESQDYREVIRLRTGAVEGSPFSPALRVQTVSMNNMVHDIRRPEGYPWALCRCLLIDANLGRFLPWRKSTNISSKCWPPSIRLFIYR